MDKNTTALTIGLGLIGIVLAFFGYQSSETNTSPDEISKGGSGRGRGRGDEEGEISRAQTLQNAETADVMIDNKKVDNTTITHTGTSETVSTIEADTQLPPTIREDVKQEIAKEADTWDSFWKQEYEKQNEEDNAADF